MGELNDLIAQLVEWRKSKGFETGWDNFAEKCMLIVTEVSEAVEAHRALDVNSLHNEGADVDHIGEELADVFIRWADLIGSLGFDAEAEIAKKMAVNENRPYKHGKSY